jgi:DNA-binding transcriptional LysR family regulator
VPADPLVLIGGVVTVAPALPVVPVVVPPGDMVVEVSAPSMAALPQMVVGTDRIATVHRRLALQAEKVLPIKLWPPPLEVPMLVQTLQWHRHRDADPALQWMRELAFRVGRLI